MQRSAAGTARGDLEVLLRGTSGIGRLWTPATGLLLAVNLLGFGLELSMGASVDPFLRRWGLVPSDLLGSLPGIDRIAALVTLLTSTFLHAGWLHLLSNLVYLAVFGPPVERRLGATRFAVLYLSSGLIGSVAYVLAQPDASAPAIGASGAIAGVIAADLVLYPGAVLGQLAPVLFLRLARNPYRLVLLLVWLATQLLSGVASLGSSSGIAWWAHLGGFVAGLTLVTFIRNH